MQDFGDDAFGTENGYEIFLTKVVGFHQSAKDFDGRSIGNGMMRFFVGFDEREKEREAGLKPSLYKTEDAALKRRRYEGLGTMGAAQRAAIPGRVRPANPGTFSPNFSLDIKYTRG